MLFMNGATVSQITNILKGTIMSEKEELPRKEIEILNMKVDKLPVDN